MNLFSVTSIAFFILFLAVPVSLAGDVPVFTYGEEFGGTPVRIVGDRDYAPVEWLEEGEAKGIIPSLLPELSQALQRKIEYRLLDWKLAQQLVKEGDADVLTVFSPNEERVLDYDFVEGILQFEMSLFVPSENITLHTLSDLKGVPVGISQGGFLRNFLESHSQAELITISDHESGFLQLKNGEFEALATTKWVGAWTLQKAGITGIKYVDPPLHVKPTHLGIKKGNSELQRELDRAIKELKNDGTIKRLTAQWENLEIVYLTQGRLQSLYIRGLIIFILFLLAVSIFVIIILKRLVNLRTESLRKSNEELNLTLEKLQKTRDKLVQSEKVASLSSLVAGLSHEMNTPLGIAVTLASNMCENGEEIRYKLNEENFTVSDFKAFMEKMKESCSLMNETLARLVQLINSFKRIADHQSEVQRQIFKPGEVIHSVILRKKEALVHQGVKVDVQGDENLEMEGYPMALSEVLSHLIANSLRHAFLNTENPHMSFNYFKEGDEVFIRVADNGCGIDHSYMNRLFDPFFTTQLGRGSSGLGLSLVYTVTKGLLGGEILVENSNGLLFTMVLPCVAPTRNVSSQKDE